jgi:ech hydrogenase subunit D
MAEKPQVFIDIEQSELAGRARDYCERGWRFANLCGSTVEGGVELIYSFSDCLPLENLRFVTDLTQPIDSVSACFPNAFIFENETHDLFGVSFAGISLDFDGAFYTVSVPTPMNPAASHKGEASPPDSARLATTSATPAVSHNAATPATSHNAAATPAAAHEGEA